MPPTVTPMRFDRKSLKVSKIIGIQLKCRAPIRLSKTQKAQLRYKENLRAQKKAAAQAATEHHADCNVPW